MVDAGLVDMPKVTVKLERSVTDKLKAASSNMNDTYDSVILRLLEDHAKLAALQVRYDEQLKRYDALMTEVKKFKQELYDHNKGA